MSGFPGGPDGGLGGAQTNPSQPIPSKLPKSVPKSVRSMSDPSTRGVCALELERTRRDFLQGFSACDALRARGD